MRQNTVTPDMLKCGDCSGETETVRCPICEPGPPHPTLIYRKKDGVCIWQCPACELQYASPRFTEKSLLKIYENPAFIGSEERESYNAWTYEKWQASGDCSYVSSKLRTQLISRYLSKSERVLDIGCSTGLFCLEASKQGWQVDGIEPSAMLTGIANNIVNVPVQNITLEEYRPPFRYHGLVIWDVLEHVYDPVRILNKCYSLLADKGFLFLHVPNFEGLSNRYKTLLCQWHLKKCDFKHFGFPWHIYAFNQKSLSKLLQKTGFEPVEFESWTRKMRRGEKSLLPAGITSYIRKQCLTDYITCVGQKK